jgi:hypothetical protein
MSKAASDEYIIFHKDYPVLSVELDDRFSILKVKKIFCKERLFPGLYRKQLNIFGLNDWFFSRGIPAKRQELPEILESNNVETRQELVVKNLGLGLTDFYWIKKADDVRKWADVNFFDNIFSTDNQNAYLGKSFDNDKKREISVNKLTPSNVSCGMLPKMWQIINGGRYMIKGSELQILQEPFNEVILSKYLDKLGVDHVNYELYWHKKLPYSKCPNMLQKGEELIHSYYVLCHEKKNNSVSYLDHYIAMCEKMGLKNIRKALDDMILFDYMSANTDRHWSNFGIIRDSETLLAKRLAPLYDHGAALYAKFATMVISKSQVKLKCQSFASWQDDNIKMVSDFSLLENKNVNSLPNIIEKNMDSRFIDSMRKRVIISNIEKRIQTAQKIRDAQVKKRNIGPSSEIAAKPVKSKKKNCPD